MYSTGVASCSSLGGSESTYWASPAVYATSGQRTPVTSRATWMRLATCELRMNRPRALAGFTPIICSVRMAEEPLEEPVLGGGEPCRGGGAAINLIAAVSAGCWLAACGRGGRVTPAATGAPAAARRCGSLAIEASSSLTLCG